jgi:glycosyltransferase involved in cell wall biosynthesis
MNASQFSVIIPVYNDPCGITETLRTISDQNFPQENFEVIIVDNASNDVTAETVHKFTSENNNFFLFSENIKSSYAARNTGISHARGDYLLFVDSNMTVEKDWLGKIKQFVDATEPDYFGMRVSFGANRNAGVCYIDEQLTGFPVHSYLKRFCFVPTCCLGVSKQLISRIGDFDSRLVSGGDQEFGQRVSLMNIRQLFAHDIVISHPPRTNLVDVLKKNVRIGRGFYQLGMFYPKRYPEKIRNILNPIYLLPAYPQKYTEMIKGDSKRKKIWHRLNAYMKIRIFLLWWLRKLAVHVGYFKEHRRTISQKLK